MAPVIVNPDHVRAFPDAARFEKWLSANHDKATEIWLKIHKKESGLPTVTHAEALDVALCWGWIDAIRKSFDDNSFLQRFTPRGPKSIWSQRNVAYIERLTAAGRMTPHGQAHADAAKADGRWQAAYAAGRDMQVPEDLLAAIAANASAQATFETLNKQNRFSMAFRIGNLKTPEGRVKKIAAFVDMLAKGDMIYPNGKITKATAGKKP